MKTLALAIAILAAYIPACAQNSQTNAKSRNYDRYRMVETMPPYGLKKIQRMIARIKPNIDDYGVAVPRSEFESMPFLEKFTYVMIHREDMNQNCDAMPAIVAEETKAFGHLPDPGDSMAWSDREIAFLKNNKPRIIPLLRTEIRNHGHVGLNVKMAVVELDAYSLIPDLVASFERNPKDLDMMTTLFLLMQDGKYGPFLKSETYKKLYGDNASYQSFVIGNRANQKLTEQRAMAFFRSIAR